jgi:AAA ATPase domain/Adenylate and Guanylate cyclase catalytic domain
VQEDDALRAVRAADEIRRLLPGVAQELGVDLTFRTGINTGEVVVGAGQTLATGDAVNVAARLEQAAAPGEIVIGADTRRLVRDAIACEPMEPLALKGKAEPVTAFRLLGVDDTAPALARHLDAPLVGRERELRLLRQAYDRAVEEGSCHLFTLLGMAGAGKSRLTAELLGSVAGEATILRGRCLHYGDGITFWPLVEALAPLGDQAADLLERIEQGGGTSPEELFWEIRRRLEAVAADRPLILVVEDLQWAEPMLLDLIDHVADLSRGVPILLLCIARPELIDERPGWGGGKLNATTVLLEPLSQAACGALLDDLAGDFDGATRERILRASGGNPLFVEEMVALVRDGGGSAVPATIRALLDARIERLGGEERAVIERGAVEGEVFHRAAVQALLDGRLRAGLQGRLAGLIRKEMIRPHAASLPGHDAFRFRHLLIRDAAYDALPKQARAELHERFADWLDGEGAQLAEVDEIAGWHLEQAIRFRRELGLGVPPGAAARAVGHLDAAGRRAADRHDLRSADRLFTRALDLIVDGDPHRSRLALALAESLIPAGDDPRIDELLAAAEADERTRAEAEVARAEWLLQIDPAESLRRVDATVPALQRAAEAARDNDLLARIHKLRFLAEWTRSRAAPASEALAQGLVHAERAGDRALAAELRGWGAGPIMLGPATPAEMEQWIETTSRGELPPMLAFGLELARGWLATMEYRLDEALEHFATADGLLRELGFDLLMSSSGQMTFRPLLVGGDVAGAISVLQRSYDEGRRIGDRSFLFTTAAYLAEVLRRAGRLDEAEALALEVERESASQDTLNFAFNRATRALVAAARGRLDDAVALGRSAVARAELTDMPVIRAEALVALGAVLRASTEEAEAADVLERAIALAEAKGDQPMADRARAVAAGGPA